MDLCVGLMVAAVVVFILAGVGHVIWLIGAALLRVLFPTGPPRAESARERRPRRRCLRCGTIFGSSLTECPSCGLEPEGGLARELRDLETAARSIQGLLDSGKLDPELAERIYESIEKGQAFLLQGKSLNLPGPSRARNDLAGSPQERLERLLEPGIKRISHLDRMEALAIYRQVPQDELARLPFRTLWHLGQLVNAAGMASRSMQLYELVLATYPRNEAAGTAALEAGKLALRLQDDRRARTHLRLAAETAAHLEERQDAQELLRTLTPVQEEPLQAITVEPVAAVEAPVLQMAASVPAPEPTPPPRTFGHMLGEFMESSNILWGELVGGLLIVGCSIALVISLWQTLEHIRYFPFLAFGLITLSLFGAGFYTLSHWKLEATSRGLLVIANLLVPLDFLVLAGLPRGGDTPFLDWGVQLVAVIALGWLVQRSGRILLASLAASGPCPPSWLLTVAVVGASATQLLVPRWLDLAEPILGLFVLLSLLPVVLEVVSLGLLMLDVRREEPLRREQAHALLLFLGQATFAVSIALGFIVYWSDDPLLTFRHLAVPLALAGLPLAVCGLHVDRRLGASAPEGEGDGAGLSRPMTQLVGTVMTGVGLLVLIGALGLGWPRPVALISIGLGNSLVLVLLALWYRQPVLHGLAMPCFAVAFLTLFHALRGELSVESQLLGSRMRDLALDPSSGVGWIVIAGLLAMFSEWLGRKDRRQDALFQIVGSAVAAGLALALIVRAGVEQPGRGAAVFGAFALGSLAINLRWRQAWVSWVASAGLLGCVGYLGIWISPHAPLKVQGLVALLTHATVVLVGGFARSFFAREADAEKAGEWQDPFDTPLILTGQLTSVLAVPLLGYHLTLPTLIACSGFCAWLAALWFLLAWWKIMPGWFAAGQLAVTAAVLSFLTDRLEHKAWVNGDAAGLLHLWSLQVYAAGLSALCLVWFVVRRGLSRIQTRRALLEPGWPTVDWTTLGLVVIAQLVLAGVALAPEVLRELTPRGVAVAWRPAAPFDSFLGWGVLAILTVPLLLSVPEKRLSDTLLGGLLLAVTAPVLAAQVFRDDVAAASGYRWAAGFTFLGCSGFLWARTPLREWGREIGIDGDVPDSFPAWSRALLLNLTVVPVLLLTFWVAMIGFGGSQPAGPQAGTIFARMGWTISMTVPLLVFVATFVGHGARENSAGYIFSAGILLATSVTGGYALSLVTRRIILDDLQGIFIAQLGVATLAGWLLLWLATGRWRSRLLLLWQFLLAEAGIVGFLSPALVEVLIGTPAGFSVLDAAGYWLGWASLLGTTVGGVWLAIVWSLSTSATGGLSASEAAGGSTGGQAASGTQSFSSDTGTLGPTRSARWSVHVMGFGGLGLGILASCVLQDASGWQSYHVLTLSWTLLALILLTESWIGSSVAALGPMFWSPERRERAAGWLNAVLPPTWTRRWVEVLSLAVVLLALGGAWGDPARPYWSCAATLAVSVLFGAVAVWSRRPGYVYASGFLLNLVAYLVWQSWLVNHWGLQVWFGLGPGVFDFFLLLQVLALALGSVVWSLVESVLRRLEPPVDVRGHALPFPHLSALLAIHLLTMLTMVAVAGDVVLLEISLEGMLPWAAVGVTALALVLLFRDPESRGWGFPAAPCYALGLVALALAVHQLAPAPDVLATCGACLLAGYFLVNSLFVRLGARWPGAVSGLVAEPRAGPGYLEGWFGAAQGLTGAVAVGLAWWMCLALPTLEQRLAGPLAAALVLVGTWLLAGCWSWLVGHGQAARRNLAAYVACVLVGVVVVQISWAVADPDGPAPWLQRNALQMCFLGLAGVVLWFGVPRLPGFSISTNMWSKPAREIGQFLLGLAGVALVVLLIQEFAYYDRVVRRTPLLVPVAVLVASMLAAAVVGLVWGAVAARDDPAGFSHRVRVRLVWGAEMLLVLLLVHVRLNVPHRLGLLASLWPMLLLALGFVCVGLGDIFRRLRLPMLAEPLHQTGLAVPLVPLAAYVLKPVILASHLDRLIPGALPFMIALENLPGGHVVHATLWFFLAGLYALVAVLRQQSIFALLGALAANFGLWVFLAHEPSLAILLHPQLWLAPLGLIVLVAEHLHRERLGPQASAAVRYAGLMLIYVSASADMFITGLGNSVWLPIVLALVSVAGVLLGILLRVRAFLFMGVAFLFLVIFAQIWHAAVDRAHTWLWWACGILLGIAILALFALFEKRRNDVLKIVEELKQWR